jgi:hypothetical protein
LLNLETEGKKAANQSEVYEPVSEVWEETDVSNLEREEGLFMI